MKDITNYLMPNLVFNHFGKQYSVPPPTTDDGLLLAATSVVGLDTINGIKEDADFDPTGRLTDGQKELYEASKDRDLGDISLGPVYKEMVDDGLPGPHIDQYATYAMYYWVYGEAIADRIMDIAGGRGGEAPKDDPKPSKSGPSTE